jgi:hypothetical protein
VDREGRYRDRVRWKIAERKVRNVDGVEGRRGRRGHSKEGREGRRQRAGQSIARRNRSAGPIIPSDTAMASGPRIGRKDGKERMNAKVRIQRLSDRVQKVDKPEAPQMSGLWGKRAPKQGAHDAEQWCRELDGKGDEDGRYKWTGRGTYPI